MKECGQCGTEKRISGSEPEFYRREASKDGFQGICKVCSQANSQAVVLKKRAEKAAKKLAANNHVARNTITADSE
jgi:hypothetical protein